MTPIQITPDLLKPYLNEKKRHIAYDDMVKPAKKLRIHADEEDAGDLIKTQRPSEPDHIKKYRLEILEYITTESVDRIDAETDKIRRSDEWSIKYDPKAAQNIIAEDETLEKYCEHNFPEEHTSVTNWVFSEMKRSNFIDANACVFVMPLETEIETNEYLRPFPFIYTSEQVYEYIPGKLAILKAVEKSTYYTGEGNNRQEHKGDIFYVANAMEYWRIEQQADGGDEKWRIAERYAHNLGELPVFRFKGKHKKRLDRVAINRSRIAGIVPRLNEALREYSDLQAGVFQHVYMEKWIYDTQKCAPCNGTGKVRDTKKQGEIVTCSQCAGSGNLISSPYSTLRVKAPEIGDKQQVPIPPAGYIDKPIEIIKIQDERVEKHIYYALRAINMEYLAKTPLSESGIAKQVDRESLNTFVNAIAEDIVWAMDKIYHLINEYRYRIVVPDETKRRAMLPKIYVPQVFDLLSSDIIVEQIDKAKKANISPRITAELEKDFAKKQFVNNKPVWDVVETVFELDPLPGYTQDDKMTMLSNKGIMIEDYIMSCNIDRFVRRAVEEKGDDFFKLNTSEKRKVIDVYVKEVIEAQQAKADEEMKRQQEAMANTGLEEGANKFNEKKLAA